MHLAATLGALYTLGPHLRIRRHVPDDAPAHLGVGRPLKCTVSPGLVDARELVHGRARVAAGVRATSQQNQLSCDAYGRMAMDSYSNPRFRCCDFRDHGC